MKLCNMRGFCVCLVLIFGACSTNNQEPAEYARKSQPLSTRLSPTRALRRASLALTGKPPTIAQLESAQNGSLAIEKFIDQQLASPEFYSQMLDFGHDWIGNSEYRNGGKNEGIWRGGMQAELSRCAPGTVNEGKYKAGHYVNGGDPEEGLCNDKSAVVRMVEPWWRPGAQIAVLGVSGGAVVREGDIDCGVPSWGIYQLQLRGAKCGCGPNLKFCQPLYQYDFDEPSKKSPYRDPTLAGGGRNGYGLSNDDDDASPARQVYDEPARLVAHLAHYDLPLSELLVGDRSVGPVHLQNMYLRFSRQHPRFGNAPGALAVGDADDSWWKPSLLSGRADPLHANAQDPTAWREFTVSARSPLFLAERDYRFDPRAAPAETEPKGIATAGVLTMLGPNSSWPRERVRAARWLETFACVDFVPPPASIQFNEYHSDPAREGTCQHCHVKIDPAAVFLKRHVFLENGGNFPVWAGIDRGRIDQLAIYDIPRARWEQALIPNTLLTSISAPELLANPNSRFIDFLPPGEKLLGQTGDGTAGPLGFGKILLSSGAFDRCTTLKLYQRFVGRRLDPATERNVIEALTQKFIASGRLARPFVKQLMLSPEMQEGL